MRGGQKFPRGSFVRVAKEMPFSMAHFECNFVGVVEGSYLQICGHGGYGSAKEYQLIMLNDDHDPVNAIAWYPEELLTLVDDDTQKGRDIIEYWNFGRHD